MPDGRCGWVIKNASCLMSGGGFGGLGFSSSLNYVSFSRLCVLKAFVARRFAMCAKDSFMSSEVSFIVRLRTHLRFVAVRLFGRGNRTHC